MQTRALYKSAPLLLLLAILLVMTNSAEAKERIKKTSNEIVGNKAGCYKVAKSYKLTNAVHGLDGELQLLQDSRLTNAVYAKQFGTAFNAMYMDNDDAFAKKFKDNPPLGSVLRILSRYNNYAVLKESYTYGETPVGILEEVRLLDTCKPTYLLTLDESAGMGSYNGLMTYFYEIDAGKLKDVTYLDSKTNKREHIALMRSLKTNWKLIKSKDGKSSDILHVACRPDFSSPMKSNDNEQDDFLVFYDRFQFNGKEWVKYTIVEKDFWESEDDDDFPPVSKFPVGH